MQLIIKYKREIRFLLCIIDIYSKYTSLAPLKDKYGIYVLKKSFKAFKEITQNLYQICLTIWKNTY